MTVEGVKICAGVLGLLRTGLERLLSANQSSEISAFYA